MKIIWYRKKTHVRVGTYDYDDYLEKNSWKKKNTIWEVI